MFTLDCDRLVARITLDRAEARNAVPPEGWERLVALAAAAAAGPARVLILRSALPGVFSAGADLKQLATLLTDVPGRADFRRAMAGAFAALADLAIPSIAAIDGGCYGAGVALAMACDMRIAGPAARFAIPPARLGIAYPPGDVARLALLVGPAQATLLLASGDEIDAAEAARIGLVDRLADDAGVAAEALAARIAANAPASVRLLRRMVREPAMAGGEAAFEASFGSLDFAEGLAARRERRTPEFGG